MVLTKSLGSRHGLPGSAAGSAGRLPNAATPVASRASRNACIGPGGCQGEQAIGAASKFSNRGGGTDRPVANCLPDITVNMKPNTALLPDRYTCARCAQRCARPVRANHKSGANDNPHDHMHVCLHAHQATFHLTARGFPRAACRARCPRCRGSALAPPRAATARTCPSCRSVRPARRGSCTSRRCPSWRHGAAACP